MILQRRRDDGVGASSTVDVEAALLAAAADAGVPVPAVVAAGEGSGLARGWMVVQRVDGETIPRRILRDDSYARARSGLASACGAALASIHRIDPAQVPGLAPSDPLADPLAVLDSLGAVRPALELGVRWLGLHRQPSTSRVTVHGDFRMGNLVVGPAGLAAVLDWELAHVGDPAEDVGWLCARAWRFGGPGHVGGFGTLGDLLDAYVTAGGEQIDRQRVTYWEAYAAIKWAVICALQASAHLGGTTRSVELATIGRRVCESEWDLLVLLGHAPSDGDPMPVPQSDTGAPFGRPSVVELVEAVREHLGLVVERGAPGRDTYDERVARTALGIVQRQLELGPSIARAHARRLGLLGFDSDADLAAALRSGALDHNLDRVGAALAATARDELLVANPAYLSAERV